jgi:hypothetical protein
MKRLARSARVGLAALLALALLVPLAGPASAAPFGPDSFGYVGDTETGSGFEDISATGTRILDDNDDNAELVTFPPEFLLGGGFPFYGPDIRTPNIYTDVWVTPNGILEFGSSSTSSFVNSDLTVAGGPTNPVIAPLWDDWGTFCNGDAMYYGIAGFPTNTHFIVQWDQVSHFGACDTADTYTFQVALFPNGDIEFRYLDLQSANAGFDFGASATVGIRDSQTDGAPGNGRVLQASFDTASLADGQSMFIDSPIVGGGGGGDDPVPQPPRRARTKLVLNGPSSADAGNSITLNGKLRCKRDRCKDNAKIHIFRGNQKIGSTRTDGDGNFSFRTTVPGAGEATYHAEFNRNRRCKGSSSDPVHVS